jgi:membrane-bound serine protease (ClpP class)
MALGLSVAASPQALGAQPNGTVHVGTVQGEIERGTAAYVDRVVGEAESSGAQALVLRLDTPGGRVDAALQIRDRLLDAEVPTIAFVNRNAYSAGALIAIACESIWMAPGGVMGAATPVQSQSGKKASEKMVSAVRSAFAATAEQRGRKPEVAEAMVDASVSIEGLVKEGKLLSLTTERALEWDYADGKAKSLDAVLAERGLDGATVVRKELAPAEWLAGFVTKPAVASILMSLGFLGLLFELKTAGWGVGGTAALVFLGLFFWGHLLAGLAGWEALVLTLAGVALMLVEVLVIPGFGVAGAVGLLCFLGGLFMAMVDFGAPGFTRLDDAAAALAVAFLLALVGSYAIIRWLPGAKTFRGIVLGSQVDRDEPASTESGATAGAGPEVGARGTASTDLRPAGAADFGGRRVDVVTRGEYVEAGTPVEVVEVAGNRVVVLAVR